MNLLVRGNFGPRPAPVRYGAVLLVRLPEPLGGPEGRRVEGHRGHEPLGDAGRTRRAPADELRRVDDEEGRLGHAHLPDEVGQVQEVVGEEALGHVEGPREELVAVLLVDELEVQSVADLRTLDL